MPQCATVSSGVNLLNNATGDKQKDNSAEETETQSDDDDLTSSDGSYVKVFQHFEIDTEFRFMLRIGFCKCKEGREIDLVLFEKEAKILKLKPEFSFDY